MFEHENAKVFEAMGKSITNGQFLNEHVFLKSWVQCAIKVFSKQKCNVLMKVDA